MNDDVLARLSEAYSASASVPTLIQLSALINPWMNVVAAPIAPLIARIREERRHAFFDELAKGQLDLTQEQIESEDFLHAYFATTAAAFNTRQREKIRWFARLLMAGVGATPQIRFENEYEDFLRILDETTYRELGVLVVLEELEVAYPLEAEELKDGQAHRVYLRAHRIWNPGYGDFERVACSRVGLVPSELQAILVRLNRTGLYRQVYAMVSAYTGNLGTLTPMYYRLARVIRLRGTDWMAKTATDDAVGT
jgi:hypothetical protein